MKQIIRTIKQRIKEKEEPIDKITELDVGGQQIGKITPQVKGLLERCKSLESLILSQCKIDSLDNLPQLPNLQELDLSTNNLADSEIKKLEIYPKLISLSLADNKITKLQTVKSLKDHLKNLEVLQCMDNKIEQLPDYSKGIFKVFPKLKSLDNKDKSGKEIEEYEDFEEDEFEDGEGGQQDGEGDGDEKEKWQKAGEGSDDDQQFQEDQKQEQGQDQEGSAGEDD